MSDTNVSPDYSRDLSDVFEFFRTMYLNREKKPVNGYNRNEPVFLFAPKNWTVPNIPEDAAAEIHNAYFFRRAKLRPGLFSPSRHAPFEGLFFHRSTDALHDLAIEHAAVLIIVEGLKIN